MSTRSTMAMVARWMPPLWRRAVDTHGSRILLDGSCFPLRALLMMPLVVLMLASWRPEWPRSFRAAGLGGFSHA